MIYIITEDSKSGLTFWDELCTQFGIETKIYSSYGAGNIKSVLLGDKESFSGELYDSISKFSDEIIVHPSDTIIISYDQFGSVHLNGIKDALKAYKCKVYISTYGCYECAFLSFKRFLNWVLPVAGPDNIYLKALERFKWYLNNTRFEDHRITVSQDGKVTDIQSFFPRTENMVAVEDKLGNRILKIIKVLDLNQCDATMRKYYEARAAIDHKRFKSVEQVISDLLEVLTHKTGFAITKHLLGACWYENCCWDLTDGGHPRNSLKHCVESKEQDILARWGLRSEGSPRWTGKDKLSILLAESILNHSFEDLGGNVHSLAEILGIKLDYSKTEKHATSACTSLFL